MIVDSVVILNKDVWEAWKSANQRHAGKTGSETYCIWRCDTDIENFSPAADKIQSCRSVKADERIRGIHSSFHRAALRTET
jgi:hypothetical protein